MKYTTYHWLLIASACAFVTGLIIGILLLNGCAHKQNDDPVDNPELNKPFQEKANYYIANANWWRVYLYHRCDKATFYALGCAGGGPCDIKQFEWKPGEWHSDVDGYYCFYHGHDLGSKREISIDFFLALPFALTRIETEEAKRIVNDIITYGEGHDWNMGEGPKELVNIAHLKHIYYALQKGFLAEKADSIPESFRGHLLALYIWNMGLIRGYINTAELAGLSYLLNGMPENPLYQCLYSAYNDGNQTRTRELMTNNPYFPNDEIPYEVGLYHWGSSPAVVWFLIVNMCLQGI